MIHNKGQLTSGFTMIELLVTLGIFSVMTGVVLASYRTYDTNANFANASEDIVLALRQAQVYGVGQKGQGASFSTPYGAYFSNAAGKTHQIVIFADTVADNIYGSGDTVLQTITWSNNISVDVTGSGLKCDNSTGVSNLNFVFTRPFPDAKITMGNGTVCLTGGQILIKDSNTSKTATVYVSTAGQISLQ